MHFVVVRVFSHLNQVVSFLFSLDLSLNFGFNNFHFSALDRCFFNSGSVFLYKFLQQVGMLLSKLGEQII